MLFTEKKKLRYSRSKSEATIGSYWDAQIETAKIDHFTKNISSTTLFDITTLKFHEVFLDIFRKFCRGKNF